MWRWVNYRERCKEYWQSQGVNNIPHNWKPLCCQTLKHFFNLFATGGNKIVEVFERSLTISFWMMDTPLFGGHLGAFDHIYCYPCNNLYVFHKKTVLRVFFFRFKYENNEIWYDCQWDSYQLTFKRHKMASSYDHHSPPESTCLDFNTSPSLQSIISFYQILKFVCKKITIKKMFELHFVTK